MPNLADFIDRIRRVRASGPPDRGTLVGITGIDGCGKGYVTARLGEALRVAGFRVATINIDGWLRLPHDRFDPCNPAEHFYLHAIRFEDLFAELVLPLRERRSLRLEADHAAEAVCALGLKQGDTRVATLRRWLQAGRDQQPVPVPAPAPAGELIFARTPEELAAGILGGAAWN